MIAQLVLRFDETELWRQLEAMPAGLRAAFAAACAERQVPSYMRFSEVARHGRPNVLIDALGCLWGGLLGKATSERELQQSRDWCLLLLPDPKRDYHGGLAFYAEDALSSAVYAIGALLKSDAQQAMWAARCACDALYEFVSAKESGARIDQKEVEQIGSHPLLQSELNRQRADLVLLQKIAAGSVSSREGITEVRRRAQADGPSFFGDQLN